ncbi:MAG TPA: M50 family metallopeptidase [Rhabdochlamydiaceae bacterium]|nr:M50 family metallopeptidase [Rhabdochlamydiaceae bacterium]
MKKFTAPQYNKTFNNTLMPILRITALRFCYIFVHEMGHAIATKTLTGESPSVIISHSETSLCLRENGYSDRVEKIIAAAGPLAGALFTCTQIFLTATLFSSFPLIVRVIYFGALANILEDYCYLIFQGLIKAEGDWGELRKRGLESFFLTASAVAVLYTLCLRSAFKK